MGIAKRLAGSAGRSIAVNKAPAKTSGFVLESFRRAVDGVGPLVGAAEAGDKELRETRGDVEEAIDGLVMKHVQWASAQGFVTNLGGLASMAVTAPANVTGLAMLQCHLVGAIAHLRGYELTDPKVRNAVLACMLGKDSVNSLIKSHKLPSSPMAIATAPALEPGLDRRIATEVAAEMIARVAGKRTASLVGRRVPVLGGVIGGSSDAWSTYQVGRYARAELRGRTPA